MIARISPAISRDGPMAGFIVGATRPGSNVTSPQRPSPAFRLAGMRAAEEHTERPELLRPPETPGPARAARFHTILGRRLGRLVEHVISWNRGYRDRKLLASMD